MSSLSYNLRQSITVNVIGRYSNILFQLIVTAILARSLEPHDFGLVAVVSVVGVFLSFLSEMGLGPAIIRFRTLSDAQLAMLFWLTIIAGIVSGCVLAFSGPWIASLYGALEYISIATGLGIGVAFSCWAIVPLALMRRAQRFREIAISEVGSAVLSGFIAIVFAMHGAGVFALVIKSVSNSVFFFIFCLWRSCPVLTVRPINRGMRPVFSYSTYQLLFGIVNYFARNLDKLLIGRFLGASMLGLYDMSYRLMQMPVANLTHVITPALQPVYTMHLDDKDSVFRSYQKLVHFLVIMGGVVGILCTMCAGEIIEIAYGNKWHDAVPIFLILSMSIAIQVVGSSTGVIFQTLGKTNLLFYTGLISTFTMIIAIMIGIHERNLYLLSWLIDIVFFVNTLQGFYILCRWGFDDSMANFFKPMLPIIIGIGGMTGIAFMLSYINIIGEGLWFRFIIKIINVVIVYLVLLKFTGSFTLIKNILRFRRSLSEKKL